MLKKLAFSAVVLAPAVAFAGGPGGGALPPDTIRGALHTIMQFVYHVLGLTG
jgi:hypothetical protein